MEGPTEDNCIYLDPKILLLFHMREMKKKVSCVPSNWIIFEQHTTYVDASDAMTMLLNSYAYF